MSSSSTKKPDYCPNCYSQKIKSNGVSNHQMDHSAAHGVAHTMRHNPVVAGVIGATWLACKAIDHFSEKWKCENCGHKFS